MNLEDFRAIRDKLEPEAGAVMVDAVAISIAVSLKRIADQVDSFNVDGFRNQLLEIAYQASLNFRGAK
jgi:hypothetical protein